MTENKEKPNEQESAMDCCKFESKYRAQSAAFQQREAEFNKSEKNLGKQNQRLEVAQIKLANREQLILQQNDKIDKLEQLASKLAGALDKTLPVLVSYKHYVPEPYNLNPFYIIGSHEAEKLSVEALSEWRSFNEGK